MPGIHSRRLRATALVLAALTLGACDDSTEPDEPEAEIESVRLTITPAGGAAAAYTVTANSAVAAPIPLRVGSSTIVAEPLGVDGRIVDAAPELELRLEGLPAGVTFTRNGTLASTITASTPNATPAELRALIWHVAEGHDDYAAVFRVTFAP